MADKPSSKSKRLVKNPDSFRERAIKAAEASDRPSRRSLMKHGVVLLLNPIAKPLGKALRKFSKLKPVAFLLKILRLIGKIIFPAYFRNSWKELKLVTWPNWKQSRQLTFAVLVFAIVFGAAIAIVDFGLDKLFKNILLK